VTLPYTATALATTPTTVYEAATRTLTTTAQTTETTTVSSPLTVVTIATRTVTSFAKYPPRKRSIEELEKRGSLPPFLAGLVQSEISKACSCLDIPTATTTATARVTGTQGAQALTTAVQTVTTAQSSLTTLVNTVVVSGTEDWHRRAAGIPGTNMSR
jgi:hypothetical protein